MTAPEHILQTHVSNVNIKNKKLIVFEIVKKDNIILIESVKVNDI